MRTCNTYRQYSCVYVYIYIKIQEPTKKITINQNPQSPRGQEDIYLTIWIYWSTHSCAKHLICKESTPFSVDKDDKELMIQRRAWGSWNNQNDKVPKVMTIKKFKKDCTRITQHHKYKYTRFFCMETDLESWRVSKFLSFRKTWEIDKQ